MPEHAYTFDKSLQQSKDQYIWKHHTSSPTSFIYFWRQHLSGDDRLGKAHCPHVPLLQTWESLTREGSRPGYLVGKFWSDRNILFWQAQMNGQQYCGFLIICRSIFVEPEDYSCKVVSQHSHLRILDNDTIITKGSVNWMVSLRALMLE